MNHKAVRSDLSEWVIHFVHERKPESEISSLQEFFEPGYTGEFKYPDYFDSFGEGQCIFSTYDENEYKIPRDADAFQVLLKILHDGFLHSGWSRRNGSPTIYGPRSAVCFTEMPLHAFLKYADDRGNKTGLISRYAIALKRKELFKAEGRPVIYVNLGLSYYQFGRKYPVRISHRYHIQTCGKSVDRQLRTSRARYDPAVRVIKCDPQRSVAGRDNTRRRIKTDVCVF